MITLYKCYNADIVTIGFLTNLIKVLDIDAYALILMQSIQ